MARTHSTTRASRGLVLVVAAALVIAGCVTSDSPSVSPKDSPSVSPKDSPSVSPNGTQRSAPTGTLRVALSELGTEKFDPRMDIGGAQLVWTEIYDQLLGIDSFGRPDNSGLAESWDLGADGNSITFNLKKGVLWHDGSKFTADDVVFSVDYYRTTVTLSPAKGFVTSVIKSAVADDPYRVTLRLNGTAALALAELSPAESFFFIVPKLYVGAKGPDILSTAPIGTGPWKYSKQALGEYVELTANTNFRDPSRIPGFGTLRIYGIREGTTRTAKLRAGEVDIAQIDTPAIPVLRRESNIQIKTLGRGASTMGVFLRSYDGQNPAHNIDFRKALNLAIDRQAILGAIYPPGYAEPLPGSGLYATGAIGSDPNLAPYPYDPDTARRLLAGSYAGQPIRMYSYSVGGYDAEQPRINELLQGYWSAIGLKVQLEPMDYATFRPRVNTQNFPGPISLGTFAPAPRPSMVSQLRIYLNSHADGGTIWIYHDPAKAKAWLTELTAITDPAKLASLLGKINRDLYDDYFSIPLFELNIPYAINTNTVNPSWVPGNLRRVNIQLSTAHPRK